MMMVNRHMWGGRELPSRIKNIKVWTQQVDDKLLYSMQKTVEGMYRMTYNEHHNLSEDQEELINAVARETLDKLYDIAREYGIEVWHPTADKGIEKQNINDEEKPETENIMTSPIEDMELSVHAYLVLKRSNINTVADIMKKSPYELRNLWSMSPRSFKEVICLMESMNTNYLTKYGKTKEDIENIL